ncbi:hypothetical protein C465_05196 [Halorubrum distributum JCM 9100]|uniref:Uncharacterized protein n=2 Tax=Halorubrum distributum TaxID=29283 RepID=M0ESD3_9EURY|nr:hypothetical protein C465_05196 [Halorubrum distributum JCM 9100]ELZ52864.1 hypothetical protein C466_09912 [Halorubrum distributum JCM 10118]
MPLFIGEFLSEYFRESVVLAILAGVVLLRFRRYRAVAGAGAAAAGSAATVAVAVVVTLIAIVALGYWEPPVEEIIADGSAAARGVYEFILQPIVDIGAKALRTGTS